MSKYYFLRRLPRRGARYVAELNNGKDLEPVGAVRIRGQAPRRQVDAIVELVRPYADVLLVGWSHRPVHGGTNTGILEAYLLVCRRTRKVEELGSAFVCPWHVADDSYSCDHLRILHAALANKLPHIQGAWSSNDLHKPSPRRKTLSPADRQEVLTSGTIAAPPPDPEEWPL